MAKTYTQLTAANATAGNAILASDINALFTNSNNYRVPPMCKVLLTGNKTVTAGVAIPWDTDAGTYGYDTDDMWTSGSSTRITLNTSGIYLLQASIQFTTSGGTISTIFGPTIILNGTTAMVVPAEYNVNGGAGSYRAVSQTVYRATAGDYFVCDFNPLGATGTLTLENQPNTYFAATWLGQVS